LHAIVFHALETADLSADVEDQLAVVFFEEQRLGILFVLQRVVGEEAIVIDAEDPAQTREYLPPAEDRTLDDIQDMRRGDDLDDAVDVYGIAQDIFLGVTIEVVPYAAPIHALAEAQFGKAARHIEA
jgi:hypothetical protein